jgi:putative transposase
MFYDTMSLPKNIEKQGGYLTLAHHNTVLSQVFKLISRHEFHLLAKAHDHGPKLRKINRWTQFVALCVAQLTGRVSLRDLTTTLTAQTRKLYHLGCRKVTRSTLARVNEHKTSMFYEALFEKLLGRCQSVAPKHKFRFKNKLYSLDATVIDLCLNLFPWARFRQTKGAIKLHAGLDHDGYIPAFVAPTPGHTHEIKPVKLFNLPQGSIIVFDRAYNDYTWFLQLNEAGIYFVTRLKSNAKYKVIKNHPLPRRIGLVEDQTIRFTGQRGKQCPIDLRRVVYRDPETDKEYVYLTNIFHLSPKTIADIYKDRWQIELFFKWIKQNLKIKSFLGTSMNAVKTQIWVAMCVYLLLAYLKYLCQVGLSLQKVLRLLQLNLFERRNLTELLENRFTISHSIINDTQLALL